jgi:serpin B
VTATERLTVLLLARAGHSNLVFSPYSIQAALSMVDQGARGQTAEQITHLLGATRTANLATANDSLIQELSGQTHAAQAPTMLIANDVWLQDGQQLQSPFASTLNQDFSVEPEQVDFSGNPESARQTINSWVANHTKQLIRQLFPQGSISSATRLVLANALYLQAKWQTPFERQISQLPFHTATGTTLVPTMTGPVFSTGYASTPLYQAVNLPYANSHLSLLAIEPKQSLSSLIDRLTLQQLAKFPEQLHRQLVTVVMPKLALNTQTDLSQELATLGMPLAFSSLANFRGLTGQPLQLSTVEHQAVLKVDQNGTTAAAATGAGLSAEAVAPTPQSITVTFNHPFLLLLRDDHTGAILFAAQVVNP